MGMGESDDTSDQFDGHNDFVVAAPPKSPWKTPAAASPVPPSDSEFWPALSDARQRRKTNERLGFNSVKSPPAQAIVEDDCGRPPVVRPSLVEQKKFHGRGNIRSPRKPACQHKKGPKHHGPDGAAPFTVPLPYYPPTVTPPSHTMVPVPPGYPYPFPSGAFVRVDGRFIKSSGDAPSKPFVHPANGDVQSSLDVNSNAHDSNFVEGGPNAKEQDGQIYPSWSAQRPAAINHTFHVQPTMGPRPFIRSPFPAPGFVDGANLPGSPGTLYYIPCAPSGSVRVPYPPIFPYFFSSGSPMPPSPDIALRANIVKQIEYYFSDENLQNDHYLISLMDNQGWVPLSIIADFKRVKRMNADIPFILDALQASETIEVEGEMLRRRNEWSKWIPASVHCKTSSLGSTNWKNYNINENRGDCLKGPRVVRSSDGFSLDPVQLGKVCANEPISDNTDQNGCKASFSGETYGKSNSGSEIDLYLDNTCNGNKLDNEQNCSCFSQGSDSANSSVDIKKSRMLANPCQNVCLNDLSNDFSSSLMLDEELELEQRTGRSGQPFTRERFDEGDDGIME